MRWKIATIGAFVSWKFAIAVVTTVTLSACDVPVPSHHLGTPVPNARIEVNLLYSRNSYELFLRFESMARDAGYTRFVGNPIKPVDLTGESPVRSFQWNAEEGSVKYPQFVRFMFPYRDTEQSQFTFILERWREEGFYEIEWREFVNWRDEILPITFPSSNLRTTRHPSVFTNFEFLDQISQSTGEPIPDKVQINYDEWLSTQP